MKRGVSPSKRRGRGGSVARCPRPGPSRLTLEPGTPSNKERIDAVLHDDALFSAAGVIPVKKAGSSGRSRKYPEFVWTLWPELRGIFGGHTAVARELGRGGWWTYIRQELGRIRPELAPLPAEAPRRQDYEYMRDRYLITDEVLAASLAVHAEVAIDQAKEAGNLDPEGPGSFTHPDLSRTFYGDGKVITPLYKKTRGGKADRRPKGSKRKGRIDPDAGWHVEGGNTKQVWGTKFALLSTRVTEGRFIVGLEHVEGDEAAAAVTLLKRAQPHSPGAQAVVWDNILRGVHINRILTEVGIVPIVGVHAKKNPEGGEGRRAGRYTPKTADTDTVIVRLPDGAEVMVHLSAYDGALSLKRLTETGEPHYEPLAVTRLQRNPNKHGFRWYGYYNLPGSLGGKEISVRHHQNADDDTRGLNRTENLRPIPESSPDFARLRVLRPDAESINRGIEDSLFINRASAKGWRRQMVDLLGHARLVNALTLARCRARLPVEAVA